MSLATVVAALARFCMCSSSRSFSGSAPEVKSMRPPTPGTEYKAYQPHGGSL